MKRLIALLIAILTLLFGGVQPADESQDEPELVTAGFESRVIETESVPELSTEKEKPDAAAEAEADQPEDITPSEPETTEDVIEQTDEPIPDTDTFFSQLTEEEPTAEEQTEPMPEPTVQSEPQVIPSTPVAEETTPLSPEKETEDSTEQNSNAPIFVDPGQGGANPFENAPPTEIDDHPADEFIGEGDDRPGEGIHF